MKADNIQEGVGAIRHDVGAMRQDVGAMRQGTVDVNVTAGRTETRVQGLQDGVRAIRQNMVDEKVSRQ
jgi:hypothetical protein